VSMGYIWYTQLVKRVTTSDKAAAAQLMSSAGESMSHQLELTGWEAALQKMIWISSGKTTST